MGVQEGETGRTEGESSRVTSVTGVDLLGPIKGVEFLELNWGRRVRGNGPHYQ